MLSDPIADMLTRIRNALMVAHPTVAVPHSRMKAEIARILKDEGYIENYSIVEDGRPSIVIELKYFGKRRVRRPVISGIKRVSRPGRRVYAGKTDIPWVLSGMGIAIMSTPRGLMTGAQARREGVGGEVIAYVW
jgi:small subunit ribosomal protein S8